MDPNTNVDPNQVADLNNAVTSLATAFSVLDGAVQAQLRTLSAALTPKVSQTNPEIAQAIANISALTNKMAQDAAALTAHVPAATTIDPPLPATPVVVGVGPTIDIPTIAKPTITAPDAVAPAEVDVASVTTDGPRLDPDNPAPAPATADPSATKPVMQQAPGSPIFE
jgi:hypothetical protein